MFADGQGQEQRLCLEKNIISLGHVVSAQDSEIVIFTLAVFVLGFPRWRQRTAGGRYRALMLADVATRLKLLGHAVRS